MTPEAVPSLQEGPSKGPSKKTNGGATVKVFSNVVVCWKCEGCIEIYSDNEQAMLDDVPDNCPNTKCGAEWTNSRRFVLGVISTRSENEELEHDAST